MTARAYSLILTENLFSAAQFTDASGTVLNTVSAEEAATGNEARKVANGRRSSSNYWASTTANSVTWIQSLFDRVRAFNLLVIDRGHNLGGVAPSLLVSSDDFANSTTVINPTIPTVSRASHIDNGALTEEGAYIHRFPLTAGTGVRLQVPAMGAGVVPNIVGLYAGLALAFPYPASGSSVAVGPYESVCQFLLSDRGWRGVSDVTQKYRDTLQFRGTHPIEESQWRYHLSHFNAMYPAWFVQDVQQADRAVCVVKPDQGAIRIEYRPEWWNRPQVTFGIEEHEPK